MKVDISKYDFDTRLKVYEMLSSYDKDIDKLLGDLETLQEIQERLYSSGYYTDEIVSEEELELLCDIDYSQIDKLKD